MIGQAISHYKIIEKLGEGGMGIVYKAEDTKLNRTLALKFLPPHLTHDAATRKRFLVEAQAESALDHPNICNIHEIDETEDGQLYICMAYYPGESLKQKIKNGPLTVDEAIHISINIARGLFAAHKKNIIHRDIKPGNIMITETGEIKIVDFGLARLTGEELTKTFSTKGTIAYMAPEIIRGLPGDERSDIWSLGVILYEMLTGHLPFKGDFAEPMMYAIVNKKVEPLTNYLTDVPEFLQSIVNRTLKKDPQHRYHQADDLILDLARFMTKSDVKIIDPTRRIKLTKLAVIIFIIMIVFVAGYIYINHIESSDVSKSNIPAETDWKSSIAVLPFNNISNDPDQEHFCEGITDQVLTNLSKIKGLKVIGRTSVLQYSNTAKSPSEIGDELGVQNILEGSAIKFVAPIFYGGELVAFAANKGHWTEVGGMAAGSWTTNSTEIYQEGLQFPCVKLFDQGEPIQSMLDIIRANVRTPDMSIGDMYAQVASMRIAEQRFQEMCDKYGVELVLSGIQALLDYGEALTRQEIDKLPDGIYEAVDYIDDDGIGNGPFEVRIKITIEDDRMVCDYTGTHAQVPGPVNCARTGLYSAARAMLMALTDPAIPASEGCFRALEVICPDDTIFTCSRPAPVSTYWETMLYAADLIWKAMAPVLPDRLPAGHFLSVCGVVLAGIHPDTGELFLLVEPQAGGYGAGVDKDGENGLVCVGDGETYIIPIEVCETRYGVIVDQFGFDIADGGAGEFRGGRGLVRDYRVVGDQAFYTGTFGRFKFLPWGMEGGAEGSKNYTKIIFADGSEPDIFGKTAQYKLGKGDVASLITGTGGGYGNPANRPVEMIRLDVKNGYITLEQAEKEYGVVLNPETLEVEELVGIRAG